MAMTQTAQTTPGTCARNLPQHFNGCTCTSATGGITAEADVDLIPLPAPEPAPLLDVADVKVGRADADGHSQVVERATGLPVGSVLVTVDADGVKRWTPCDLVDEPLTYPSGQPKAYLSRTHAVRSLLEDDLHRPENWADAPAYDWTQQRMGLWGKRFAVADMTKDTALLHASPHRFEPGDLLVPDQAPVNFKQSDPFTVALTNQRGSAHHWGKEAVGGSGTFYVYEVEPLTPVKAWRYAAIPESGASGAVEGASLRLEEGRVGAARITGVYEVTR